MDVIPYAQASLNQEALEALDDLVQHARKRGIEEDKAARQTKEDLKGEPRMGCPATEAPNAFLAIEQPSSDSI